MSGTLAEKVWEAHVVRRAEGEPDLLYIDLHLLHEVTSPQAFDGLRLAGRPVRRPDLTLATEDHNVPTTPGPITDPVSKVQVDTLRRNCAEFGIRLYSMGDVEQGIVHVVGPQLGLTQPGTTVVCGDSHTTTYGALGALGFGIGTSEVEHVLATQTLVYRLARDMRIRIDGRLPVGTTSKDLVLMVIGRIGAQGARGCVVEFCGSAIEALSVEARFTLCNMAVEAGARGALIAPDAAAIDYVLARAPDITGEQRTAALTHWATLSTDDGAPFDIEHRFDAADVVPWVTWGTSPDQAVPVTGRVPAAEGEQRTSLLQAMRYTGLAEGTPLEGLPVQHVFIGSCTNARIEDLRAAAAVVKGRHVAPGLRAMVVPGSGAVKQQAEAEGVAQVLIDAGFEWRQPGCSMCLAMNDDVLAPGQRCASTTNRNFEGRQGRGGGHRRAQQVGDGAAAAVTGTAWSGLVPQVT